jgi:hypothetical protein
MLARNIKKIQTLRQKKSNAYDEEKKLEYDRKMSVLTEPSGYLGKNRLLNSTARVCLHLARIRF